MDKGTFGKVYTGDYSKEGYDAGMGDRKAHQPKNKLKILKVLHPVNYLWQFNHAFESFSQNYDAGYLDAQRVTHQVFNDTRSIGGMSMAVDNYENHIRALEDFRSHLMALKRYLISSKDAYAKQLLAMESAGFMENVTHPLQQRYQIFSDKLDQLNNLIAAHDQKLALQKEALEQLAQIARMNP